MIDQIADGRADLVFDYIEEGHLATSKDGDGSKRASRAIAGAQCWSQRRFRGEPESLSAADVTRWCIAVPIEPARRTIRTRQDQAMAHVCSQSSKQVVPKKPFLLSSAFCTPRALLAGLSVQTIRPEWSRSAATVFVGNIMARTDGPRLWHETRSVLSPCAAGRGRHGWERYISLSRATREWDAVHRTIPAPGTMASPGPSEVRRLTFFLNRNFFHCHNAP